MTPVAHGLRTPDLRGPSRSTQGSPRRIAIIGAGPAGLFLARMIPLTCPGSTVDVYERSGRENPAGFGVSLSGRTMHNIAAHDQQTHTRIAEAAVPLSGLELRLPEGVLRYDGFGLSAISRRALLSILHRLAEEAGARLHFGQEVCADDLDADVVAIADGARSAHRTAGEDVYGTCAQTGSARYIWLGTEADFSDVTVFAFVRTPYGPMAAHCYPYGEGMSTVVVETDEITWRNAGFGDASPGGDHMGDIDPQALALLTEIFADHLRGRKLVSSNSRWSQFRVVRNDHWSHGRTVLLGDAAHTAHFTVGSGTKMALEDALALATALRSNATLHDAFAAYEGERRPLVGRTQDWAGYSMRWWETYGRRLHMPPAQFGIHFLTRTPAMSYLGLRRRCGDRIDEAEAAYVRQAAPAKTAGSHRNAVGAPLRRGALQLPNRLVSIADATDRSAQPPQVSPAVPLAPGLTLLRGDRPARDDDGLANDGRSVLGTLLPPEDGLPVGPASGPQFVELPCPDAPESGPAGDALVQRASAMRAHGVDGVLLRTDDLTSRGWYRTLAHADRIRTEAELAVAVCVPTDWALDMTRDAETDSWPTRIHVALVSGRIDLVAAVPGGTGGVMPKSSHR